VKGPRARGLYIHVGKERFPVPLDNQTDRFPHLAVVVRGSVSRPCGVVAPCDGVGTTHAPSPRASTSGGRNRPSGRMARCAPPFGPMGSARPSSREIPYAILRSREETSLTAAFRLREREQGKPFNQASAILGTLALYSLETKSVSLGTFSTHGRASGQPGSRRHCSGRWR